jgi:hypothetical protein
MAINADSNDLWVDENGNQIKMIAYNFVPTDHGGILYGTLSNGVRLPYFELKTKYKKVGLSYIGMNKKK